MVIKSWKNSEVLVLSMSCSVPFSMPFSVTFTLPFVVLFATLTAWVLTSCGKPSDGDGSGYQSCIVSGTSSSAQCVEAKDSTDMKSACESYPGVYSLARCNVNAGVKGCKYTNKFGVLLTDWFTGESYQSNEELIQSQCAGITKQGVVITK